MDELGTETNSLPIIVTCQVEQTKLDAFASLVREVLPLASIPDLTYLKGVLIVPGEMREQIVNQLIRDLGNSERTYSAGSLSHACAVPIEVDSALLCLVLLEESLLQQIDPAHYRSSELVSTLLEEFLHVRLYSMTWQRRGYLYPQHLEPSYKKDLFSICSGFYDEYVVNRWKASIFSSQALFEQDGQLTSGYIQYGLPLAPTLDKAATDLSNTVHDAASGKLPIAEAWTKLLQNVYREVFDPLARDAAFQSGNPPEAPKPLQGPLESWYYRQHIMPYWEQVKVQLERSFEDNLAETDMALDEMVKILENFLLHIGVSCHETATGESYIHFVAFPG
ncbi:MAG TPA: hypothetical protein VFV38_43070 [Ktedonobacteraceae bacterium]|nr:hypothetical protein [Ktedonobacteraceae bacterium]